MKKFKLNGQSVVVGMVLCAVLGVFVGSTAAGPQVVQRADAQRFANAGDIYEKTVAVETKLAAMDERLIRMEAKTATVDERLIRVEKKIDALAEEQHQILKIVRTMDKEVGKK